MKEKITSPQQLRAYRDAGARAIAVRENGHAEEGVIRVRVSMNDDALAAGGREVLRILAERASASCSPVTVSPAEKIGCGEADPVVRIELPVGESLLFGAVDAEEAVRIAEKYFP